MSRPAVVALFAVSLLLVGSAVPAVANGTYSITIENGETDVPERTITAQGEEFTVSSVASIAPGEEIDVQTSAESDQNYTILFVSSDEEYIDDTTAQGPTTTTFSTENVDPGTYSIVIVDDGDPITIQPVVITAYEATVSSPSEVSTDDEATITVSTTEQSSDARDIETVELVTETSPRDPLTATQTTEGEFVVNTKEAFDPGEYNFYAVVRSGEEVSNGQLNVISMSDEHTLTVSEADQDENEESTDEEGSNENPGGGGSEESTGENSNTDDENQQPANETNNQTTNETDENISEPNEEDEDLNSTDDEAGSEAGTDSETQPSSDSADSTTDSEQATDDTTTNETDSQVTQPTETADQPDSGDSTPLNGIQLLIGTLLSIGLLVRLRR